MPDSSATDPFFSHPSLSVNFSYRLRTTLQIATAIMHLLCVCIGKHHMFFTNKIEFLPQ
uniref:Uncharacterized protein n=1 Tax=Arundo donax TaxID=35708 RepID=A0A0A9BGS2_ARUDO